MSRSSLLHAVSAASGASAAAAVQRIVQRAIELIPGADGSTLELVQGDDLVYLAAAGSQAELVGSHVDLYWSLSGKAVLSDSPFRCDDTRAERRANRDDCDRGSAASIICVPLRRGAVPIGVLKVTSRQPDAFTTRDVATLDDLGEFVSATVAAMRDVGRTADELFAAALRSDPRRADVEGISAFVAHVIDPVAATDAEAADRVMSVLEGERLTTLFQPIVELDTMQLAGAEALSRVLLDPPVPAYRLFAAARSAGLGADLQLLAVRRALAASNRIPGDGFVSVNLDVDGICQPRLASLLEVATRPLVIELTEEVKVDDYQSLRNVLSTLRRVGVRLAVDDTGAGYASLSHVVKLAPELIKLDIELICGIDSDSIRRKLVAAVVNFAAETGTDVVAEGIETRGELEVVRELGVRYGQGYLLGRPTEPELLGVELAGVRSALD